MTTQILIGVGVAIGAAVLGYFLGTRIRGRAATYKAVFVGIVVGTVGVLTVAFFRSDSLLIAISLGAGFGLLNGVRHGFTRPFEGLTPGTRDTSQD